MQYERRASISKAKQTIVHRNAKDVFNMVKDLEVIFGKGPGSQPVPNESGMTSMWKKKSIFWELPYWEVLDVRHAIM